MINCLAFLFSFVIVFAILGFLIAYKWGEVVDRRSEKALLEVELLEFSQRLELAERYDNVGEREFYKELISLNKSKLDYLMGAKSWVDIQRFLTIFLIG